MSNKRAETPSDIEAKVERYTEARAKGAEVLAVLPEIEQSMVKLLDATPTTKPEPITDVQAVITIGRVENKNYDSELKEYERRYKKDTNTFWLSLAGYLGVAAVETVISTGSILGLSVLNPATVAALVASMPWLVPTLGVVGTGLALAAIISTGAKWFRPRPVKYHSRIQVDTAK